jgi:hypothetical protein
LRFSLLKNDKKTRIIKTRKIKFRIKNKDKDLPKLKTQTEENTKFKPKLLYQTYKFCKIIM